MNALKFVLDQFDKKKPQPKTQPKPTKKKHKASKRKGEK